MRETPRRDGMEGRILDGRYEVVQRLGEGGMGLVYEARHVILGSRLAIKVLRASMAGPSGLERLKREAQAASAIGDEHIVDVRDFGRLEDGQAYVVMEHLDGFSLYERVQAKRLEWERACHIATQVCHALAAAHAAGIIHRDLKPENVLLVERRGDPDFVKILDFGIAKLQNVGDRLTLAGQLLGTPQYMSPEQCIGHAVDHRTDIYALGILLYEMVTGAVPFDDESVMELCRMQRTEIALAPSLLVPEADLPMQLETVILKCLTKRPEDRYQSMGEVADALASVPGFTPAPRSRSSTRPRVLTPPSSTAPVSVGALRTPGCATPEVAPQRRRRRALAAAALITALLGATAWLGSSGDGQDPVLSGAASVEATSGRPTEKTAAPRNPPPLHAAERTIASGAAPSDDRARGNASAEAEGSRSAAASAATVVETIIIESAPSGAEVHIDGAPVGRTPLTIERPAGDAVVELTISRPGHDARTVAVSSITRERFTVPLAPRPAARPPRIRAPIRAEPVDAEPVDADEEAPTPAPEEATPRGPFLNPWN